MAALEASLERARIKFWDCPMYGKDDQHPRIDGHAVPTRVRIQWDDDKATCLDCGRTSQDEGRERD